MPYAFPIFPLLLDFSTTGLLNYFFLFVSFVLIRSIRGDQNQAKTGPIRGLNLEPSGRRLLGISHRTKEPFFSERKHRYNRKQG